ncbi:hypothetical protein L596_022135 [Steinernema carpocapsae]|uniref:Secreted protein n=1 Tax=Steinernema carpocapsae TaxID=34508 RepID=A0A4U5MKX4_STECR|nr:hypothetical protein L596_022135 [Steinernema carpocapsae]
MSHELCLIALWLVPFCVIEGCQKAIPDSSPWLKEKTATKATMTRKIVENCILRSGLELKRMSLPSQEVVSALMQTSALKRSKDSISKLLIRM